MFKKFFQDKQGHLTIWQWPNLPLWGWLVFALLGQLLHHQLLSTLGSAFLFTWAYEEISRGDSGFRRLLGAAIMIGLIITFARY